MSRRRIVRPLCAHCGVNPVSAKRCRFCSNRCRGKAQAKPRPLCGWCHERPVSRWGGKFCGRVCSGLSRPKQRPVAAIAANEQRRFKAVIHEITEQCRAHIDEDGRVPLSAVVRVVLKERKRAYIRGWTAYYSKARREAAQG